MAALPRLSERCSDGSPAAFSERGTPSESDLRLRYTLRRRGRGPELASLGSGAWAGFVLKPSFSGVLAAPFSAVVKGPFECWIRLISAAGRRKALSVGLTSVSASVCPGQAPAWVATRQFG